MHPCSGYHHLSLDPPTTGTPQLWSPHQSVICANHSDGATLCSVAALVVKPGLPRASSWKAAGAGWHPPLLTPGPARLATRPRESPLPQRLQYYSETEYLLLGGAAWPPTQAPLPSEGLRGYSLKKQPGAYQRFSSKAARAAHQSLPPRSPDTVITVTA